MMGKRKLLFPAQTAGSTGFCPFCDHQRKAPRSRVPVTRPGHASRQTCGVFLLGFPHASISSCLSCGSDKSHAPVKHRPPPAGASGSEELFVAAGLGRRRASRRKHGTLWLWPPAPSQPGKDLLLSMRNKRCLSRNAPRQRRSQELLMEASCLRLRLRLDFLLPHSLHQEPSENINMSCSIFAES